MEVVEDGCLGRCRREGERVLTETGARQRLSDFSGESASPGRLVKRLFLIQEVWVRLEHCISNKFSSDANAAGLRTRLWEQ